MSIDDSLQLEKEFSAQQDELARTRAADKQSASNISNWNRPEHFWVRRIADLTAALLAMKTGSCWCPVGIGNPMMHGHTEACKRTQELVKEQFTLEERR